MSITRAPRPTSNFYPLDKKISEDKQMNKNTHVKADSPHDELRPTDAAHERHIKHLGEQMLQHHERWAATGCFAARGSADGYRLQMEAAIGQRSPQAVAFMEAERGLA